MVNNFYRLGNIVSITSTIEYGFGSAITVPNRGFLLNNELTDFDAIGQIGVDDVHAYMRVVVCVCVCSYILYERVVPQHGNAGRSRMLAQVLCCA